jgi:hypothetical protein
LPNLQVPHHILRISLPRFDCRVGLHIVLFEVCSAFTHVAACTLARSPIRDRYPRASDISSPPCLLRLLSAGAKRRVGLAPTGKAPPCHGARGKQTSKSGAKINSSAARTTISHVRFQGSDAGNLFLGGGRGPFRRCAPPETGPEDAAGGLPTVVLSPALRTVGLRKRSSGGSFFGQPLRQFLAAAAALGKRD